MPGDNILSECKNLYQCEEVLRQWIRPGELLGRIPLGSGDWLRLSNVIKKTIDQQGASEGTNLLWTNFSTCMAVYLVHTGIRHYRAGEFWPAVEENAGVPAANFSWVWGMYFIDFIKRNKLPVFEDVKGLRYITPILGHGGIPNYCLNDFFKFVLIPAIEAGGVTAEEILDEMFRGSGLRYQVDKPIRRFLLKGGEFALDFFERTLEMARRAASEGVVPGGHELGLPDRITRAYSKWLEQAPQKNTVKRDVLKSPVISLDPYGLGVTAILHAQQFDESIQTGVNWEIKAGDKVLRVRCKAWRVGNQVRSGMEQVPLPPADIYNISLFVDGQEYRSWNFHANLLDSHCIAFSLNTGRLVRGEYLPSEGVWLLLHEGWEVVQDGIPSMDELPPLAKPWRGYTGVALYLNGVGHLKLQGPSGKVKSIPVAGQSTRPSLVGGNLLTMDGPSELTYLGGLPTLHIPCGESEGTEFLDMWRLLIIHENSKDKAVVMSAQLAELSDYMARGDQGWLLPLDAPGVLGTNALGIYRLSVRGPLGSDAVFQLTCIHGMDITVHDLNLWPAGKVGYRPVNVTVTTQSKISVEIKNCTLTKKVQQGENVFYDVLLKSDSIICEIFEAGLARPVTFRQIIRPLTWGWLGLKNSFSLVWDHNCRTLGVNEWRDNEDLQLILNANLSKAAYQVYLILRNSRGEILQTSAGRLTDQRRLRFSIGRFRDTIAATSYPEYELYLMVQDENEVLADFRVAVLDKEWRATNVQVIPDNLKDNVTRCLVIWEENDRIRNRVVRVWAIWRPWEDPMVFSVPDDNTSITLDFLQPLETGMYRFEVSYLEEDMFIGDTARPLIPDEQADNVCDLKINSSVWHRYLQTLPCTPMGNLERFLISGTYSYTTPGFLENGEKYSHEFQSNDFKALYLTGIAISNSQERQRLKGLGRFSLSNGMSANLGQSVEVLLSLYTDGVKIPPGVLAATGWGHINYIDLEKSMAGRHQLSDLWKIWPLAGLLMEQVLYNESNDQGVYTGSIVQNLGLQGLERLMGRTDEVPYRWPKGEVCQFSLANCIYRLLRYKCICDEVLQHIPREIMGDSQNVKMVCLRSAKELEDMFSLLNFDPQGLLHPDFYSWSLFRWLIDIKNSKIEDYLNVWVQDNLGRAERIMKYLSEEGQVNLEIINSLTNRLVNPKGSLPLVNFSYISGVVALAQRQMARNHDDGGYELEVLDLALDICSIYPGIYTRDLCLFEILLSILL